MKAILIVQCPDQSKWYSSLIGHIVPLGGDEGNEYRSREPEGYINYVSKKDCVIIEGSIITTLDYFNPLFNEETS